MSRRLPADHEPNALTRLLADKVAAGRRILDLTVSNPTRAGLGAYGEAPGAELQALDAPYTPDPRGLSAAREAVAALYAARGVEVAPSRVFLTAGTSEAYAHLFRLLCDEGDDVLIPCPSYPLVEPIARVENVRVERYRLRYDRRWSLDLDSLEAAAGPRTRAVVLIEPNHPTGSSLAAKERDAVERWAEARRIAIISDEVFGEFPWPPREAPLDTWLGSRRVPTFVLGGISKSCGLPQWKLGWIALAGPDAEIAPLENGLEWILDLFLTVGTPVQTMLPRLLARREAFRRAAAARVASSLRDWRAWAARVPGAAVLDADGGWSVMVRLEETPEPGRDPAEWALDRHDVLVHPAHFYDLDDDRHVVASLLVEEPVLAEALDRLAKGMRGAGPG